MLRRDAACPQTGDYTPVCLLGVTYERRPSAILLRNADALSACLPSAHGATLLPSDAFLCTSAGVLPFFLTSHDPSLEMRELQDIAGPYRQHRPPSFSSHDFF